MSGFKLKYTKFKALEGVPDCHCEAKLRKLSIKSHFSLEEQAKEDKEASDMIFEVKNYANYFILKPNSNSGSFKNCLDVGFSWQEFSCYLCWLTLKKWKTLPSFELEHKDMCIDDLYMGSHVGIAQFNSHYHLKNSSLRCSFLHDRKEVIITLEDNKQILIQYSGLYRIFIFEVTDNVVLHLHLKTPPLLFQDSSQTTTLNICPVLSKEVVGNSNMIKIILVKKNNSHIEMKELLNRLRSRCPSAVDFIFANLFQENFSQPSIEQRIKVINHLKFSCFDSVYAWKVLLNHGYMVTDQIISGEMEAEILKKEKKNPRKFQEGCYALFRAMSNGNFLVFSDGFAFYYNRPLMHAQSNPEGICTVRKVVMTPSRRIFLPPQQHIVNRVLRNYDENYVLQVSIKQENMDSINFRLSSNSNENFMEENFNLKKGFRIGGRHYEFLACANSQLREHGFWMYARDGSGKKAKDIMNDIGIENIEEDVAKKLTRMGLFFSSSVRYKTLPDSYTVSYCNDIIRSGYNFSDGIGMISPLLAYELSGSKREDKYKPSAFQIRYPGCKGMLAVNCDLKGNEIRLRRPSMVKFKSNNKERVIDILKTSAPRRVYLNRSLAMVLEQKGVPQSVMINLQERMVHSLVNRILYDSEVGHLLRVACPFLRLPYEQFHKAGFPIASDPFFRTLISVSCQRRLGLLREKANVAIPDDKGRHMFGVLDEKKLLKPTEVFVQYTLDIDNKDSSPTVICQGPVMVTRNPCHHPGDIRLLTAVDHPELHHHLDCVVFPQTGSRPLPDMMGGGDLDGDEFVVIWDSSLRFKMDDKPMDYTFKSPPRNQDDSSTFQVDSLIDFFYDYLKNNNMGHICNAHLVLADTEQKGIRSKKCMKVAQQIPRALDYNKTGILPSFNCKISEYPDFMEKKYLNISYRSNSVLGKLYRRALMFYPHGGIAVKKYDPVPHPLLEFPGWEDFKELAAQELRSYEAKLHVILYQQGLSSFEESLTGHVSKNIYASLKGDYDSLITILEKSISSLLEETVKGFEDHIFKLCRELKIAHKRERDKLKMKLASAYYMVAYTSPSSELSFPWSVGSYLVKVAEHRQSELKFLNCASSVLDTLARTLQDKHQVHWTYPPYYLYNWAKMNKIDENFPASNEVLNEIYALFENKSPRQVKSVYDVLTTLMEFLKWTSTTLVIILLENVVPLRDDVAEFLEKLIILASITYTALPLSMNLEYLGFLDPENEEENGPLSPKDSEGLRLHRKDTQLQIKEFETFLQAKSGVEFIQLEDRNSKGIVVKARGLSWQLIYLENLVYSYLDRFSVKSPCNT